jgi:hypothetical protein
MWTYINSGELRTYLLATCFSVDQNLATMCAHLSRTVT